MEWAALSYPPGQRGLYPPGTRVALSQLGLDNRDNVEYSCGSNGVLGVLSHGVVASGTAKGHVMGTANDEDYG